ncbi:glutathione S-transferase theta-1-like [Dermochelys coriacea]|uniref:glutathione S-transferase theta-1-like n=1 Tax=Dermochelys coriacea TaxID=27794 RepID=UPI001CA85C7B|nr:glutathione S-transferase theta-1-like [Dermochelys coriacea]
MGLELYLDLLSQPCRCVYMFAKKNNISFDFKPVELLKGLNIQEFSNINSLKKVPMLKDGSFTLGESTAILLYLSRKYNLHPRVLKELAEELSGPLMLLFNRSWSTGEVPEDWKIANVPVSKKGGLVENSKIMQEGQESLGNLVVIPLFTEKPIPLQKLQKALDELNNSLKKFTEKFLQDKPFIVGSEISLADLVAIIEPMQPVGAGCNNFEGWPKLLAWGSQVEEAVGKELFQEVHERILNAQDLRNVQIDPQMKKEMKPLLLKMLK